LQLFPFAVWLYPFKPPAAVKEGKFRAVPDRGTITAVNLTRPLQEKTVANLIEQIKAETVYVNVQAEKHPGGEIRGQNE